ncbi:MULTISPECIES: aKG-HExxH-type peptide beta-hydroxylase [Enterobacteriaceae]|uniref:HEXXH motif domain protein n=1 Tax=Citrobacter youngae ATCC 29220 TaxID=500640 RepID=D4BHN0_9ENTR|nr:MULTISPECIES: HEXXH motif-containing putative peptide modification protein [Enterobacteriaceae]EFE06980.1 hypothetical protein CIT292_10043 [Citrobacter youngae ATCC 29220]ELI8805491.1 hypothetical protein [Klebsiella michiganensis]MBE0154194.1 hypothetical protein [Klebsiella michiganensis]MBE0169971.1 hypothetical protein [Klebsiella michiganensis]MBE0190257.1 hypothetical protein [Klebsiella michiganensis]
MIKNPSMPDKAVSFLLFRNIASRLWSSYQHILDVTGNNNSKLASLVNKHAKDKKPSPFFVAAHHLLVQYYVNKTPLINPSLIEELLEIEDYTHHNEMDILPFYEESSSTQDRVCRWALISDQSDTYPSYIHNHDYLLTPCSNKRSYCVSKNLLQYAIQIIELADKKLYEETRFIVDEIRLFDAVNVRAGTGFNTLGLVYIGEIKDGDNVSRYIEHVVHEAAHNLLYAHWANTPLLINETDDLYFTPFRKDHRPMSAIYHAMFVLCRTIYAFDKIYKTDKALIDFSAIRSNYNEQGNDTPFKIKFFQTVDVIKKHAKLSKAGKNILEGCIDMVSKTTLEI